MILMDKRLHIFVAAILSMAAIVVSCSSGSDYWDAPTSWYDNGRAFDPSLPDVFYLVSTDIVSVQSPDGTRTYIATLNEDDRAAISPEMAKVDKMFGDSLNFVSPYYHQYSLETIDLAQSQIDSITAVVAEDVWKAFRHYMDYVNNGRPYVIVGFSQGAMYIPGLLERMSDKDYSCMAAAYMMGYRLSEEDLQRRHVIAASGEDELGVTISFNSVASVDAVWPLVNGGAVTCINPLNWKTDSTPATLEWEGDSLTVSVNQDINALLVEGADLSKFDFPMLDKYCNKGNLHHWDRKFYADAIRDNILLRTSLVK